VSQPVRPKPGGVLIERLVKTLGTEKWDVAVFKRKRPQGALGRLAAANHQVEGCHEPRPVRARFAVNQERILAALEEVDQHKELTPAGAPGRGQRAVVVCHRARTGRSNFCVVPPVRRAAPPQVEDRVDPVIVQPRTELARRLRRTQHASPINDSEVSFKPRTAKFPANASRAHDHHERDDDREPNQAISLRHLAVPRTKDDALRKV